MHVDHIIRRDVGGDDLQNLQLLCGHCNSTKGSDTMNDLWKRLIKGGVLSKEIAKTLKKNGIRSIWKNDNINMDSCCTSELNMAIC